MGNYDNIQVPVKGQPISSGGFGIPVRNAILAMDLRISALESTLANYIWKPADTSRAAITAVTDDPDLKMPVEANTKYFVEFFITCEGLAAADIQSQWTIPAGATGGRRVLGPATNGAINSNADGQLMRVGTHLVGTSVSYNLPRDAVGLENQIQEVGIINIGATAGFVTFKWAQVTSNATATIVKKDSFGRATRIDQ